VTNGVRTSVTFELQGVPLSPNRSRWAREDPAFIAWRDKAAFECRGARAKAGWRTDEEPAPRWVRIVQYRHRPLDIDHKVTSCTPLLNGMALGNGLIYDDTDASVGGLCHLLPVDQVRIPTTERERTVITVWLVQPEEVS